MILSKINQPGYFFTCSHSRTKSPFLAQSGDFVRDILKKSALHTISSHNPSWRGLGRLHDGLDASKTALGGFQDRFWLLLHWFLVHFWLIFDRFLIDSSSISEIMNDKWCLPNEQWSMLNDEWWWMMNDEWWMKNDEWWTMNDWVSHELRMMNDESRMINDEWWLPSSKCRTEKSHPFISKVSQKLDYCLSTHIRLPSQPRCLTESTESVYFTKGKTEFHSNLVAQFRKYHKS